MPHEERSQKIKEMLSWIEAKSKGNQKGATLQQIVNHVELEITEMGGTNRTIRGYIRSCLRTGLIHTNGVRFIITEEGKNWLKRKFLT